MINRYQDPPKPVYQDLLRLVKDKDYFVITTNVDHCFQKAGFDKKRLFYTQGDYGLWQCSLPCHQKTYDNEETVRRMYSEQRNMRVPSELVPRCPVCGRPMQDEDGFIYLVDRKKDVIISGGENIYPVQIEDFLHSFEPVKDVAVIGLPDKRLGEISAAIIEVKQGFECSEVQVRDYCLKLPRYKRPGKVIFADIPRNPTGKIEKPKLREMYGALNIVGEEYNS